MQSIKKLLKQIITSFRRGIIYGFLRNDASPNNNDISGNLRLKIIRAALLIPLVLSVEAGYYLIFNFNNSFSYSPVKVSTLIPGNVSSQGTLFVNNADTSEIKLNVMPGSGSKNFMRIQLKGSSDNFKGIIIFLHDEIPSNTYIKITYRVRGPQTAFRIGLIDSTTDIVSSDSEAYSYYNVMNGQNWSDLLIPLKQFKNNKFAADLSGREAYFHKDFIKKIVITFNPQQNTEVDLSDVRFIWHLNKMPEIVILIALMLLGLVLFFRTSMRFNGFAAGFDPVSVAMTARVIFIVLAVSVPVIILENSIPAGRHEVFIFYLLFILIICIDEFMPRWVSARPFGAFRYSVLIIAIWIFQITSNAFILSTLTFAALFPVVQQKKRILLFAYSAALLCAFIIIDRIKYFMPEINGALIIVGASVTALLIQEILFYEILKAENNYSKFLYENLFENSYDGIFTADVNGIIQTANYGICKMLGYSPEELTGRFIYDFVSKDDLPLLKRIMSEAVSKDFNMCDLNLIDSRKNLHTSLIRVVAIYKNNSLEGYQSIITDITDRKDAEQELYRSQQRYKAILSSIPDLVLKFKRDGVLLDYHAQTESDSLFYENLIGKGIANIFEENISRLFLSNAEKAFGKNLPQIFEYEYNPDGKLYYEEARLVPLHDGSFIAIIRDITERRQAEQKIQEYLLELNENRIALENNSKELEELNTRLEDINKSKDKFFSIVAHDLRSPFTGLLGFSDILSTQIESLSYDEIKTYAERLNHSLKNVFKLLENLLDWSRVQTGKIKFDPEDFNLEELIQRIVGIYQINASEKKIEIEINVENNIIVYADIDMADTIVRNLISNAIKFTRPGGKVFIRAIRANAFISVSVKDTGIGILPENLSRLFRIDENISTEGTFRERGTGLGLVLCKEFVEKNGGAIEVESKINIGSEFKFTLPAAK